MRVDGVELETRWVGRVRDGGPELVFLHEGLGSLSTWRDVPAAIAAGAGRPAFVYARRGHGRSSPIVPPRRLTYMHDEAASLPHVLAAAAIAAPILVGHSDGASIAIIAAGSGAVAARALVLVAPHVFVEDATIASIARAAESYAHGELRARLARHHADVDGAFWGWNRAWLDPAFRAWNIESFLAGITMPTLVVQGDADEYGTMAQVEAIARAVPRAERVIVAGEGHAPFRGGAAPIVRFLRALS